MGKVKVYYFKAYNIERDRILRSKRPATLNTIRGLGPGIQPIMETEQEIDSSLLDRDGFRRKVTAKDLGRIMISETKQPTWKSSAALRSVHRR
jgi:hypothetical protein